MLLSKVKRRDEREWYIRKAVEHGWSRNVMVHQIESGLVHRQGKAVTNFNATLPAPQSDIANEILALAQKLAPVLPQTAQKIIKQFSAKQIKKGESLFPRK